MRDRITALSSLSRLTREGALGRDLLLCTLLATFMALSAQVKIYLPFTPVPITGQVFFVLLSAGLLGGRLATFGQIEYLLFGLVGLPVFADAKSGLLALTGPTGGYLIGFIFAAFLSGTLVRAARRQGFFSVLLVLMAGVGVIHLFGLLWLSGWVSLLRGTPFGASLQAAFGLGVVPFLLLDLGKAAVAAGLTFRLGRTGE
jgi:biotin transport system substrate-specific component